MMAASKLVASVGSENGSLSRVEEGTVLKIPGARLDGVEGAASCFEDCPRDIHRFAERLSIGLLLFCGKVYAGNGAASAMQGDGDRGLGVLFHDMVASVSPRTDLRIHLWK
jgi:hypothetical protein